MLRSIAGSCVPTSRAGARRLEAIMADKIMPPVIIKKYANRRLYNTESSSYITLDHLAAMVRDNRDFKVVDAKTNDDITRTVLTQIIVEEETKGQTMLPVNFLRQLIALYGDSVQAMVPQYLEASMEAFRRNQEQFRHALAGAFSGSAFPAPGLGGFEQLAKRNMEMMQAAADMWSVGRPGGKPGVPTPGGAPDELAELKSQLAQMQAKIDKLSS
jgi:polyhydroxyalkanoate synthesis repressor PhaR